MRCLAVVTCLGSRDSVADLGLSPALQDAPKSPLLQSAADAEKSRKDRGEDEPRSPQRSGLGRHYGTHGCLGFWGTWLVGVAGGHAHELEDAGRERNWAVMLSLVRGHAQDGIPVISP